MVFLVYRIETLSFSEGFCGRFLLSKFFNQRQLYTFWETYTVSYWYRKALRSRWLSNKSFIYSAQVQDFSDHLSRLQRVATDSLGKTPLLEIHSLITNVVAIPCNKENWFVGKTVTFYPKMCLKINGSAKTEWHTPNMHAPAYGLEPKAQGNSSLEFKKWVVYLLEKMTTWDLAVGMNVLDVVC